jgi:hypothetical protein
MMKFLVKFVFARKFNWFDLLCIIMIIEVVDKIGVSLWFFIAIIASALISAYFERLRTKIIINEHLKDRNHGSF